MKLLITTRADASYIDWIELTHPIFIEYASKVKADFMVLDEEYDVPEASTGIGLGVYQYRIVKHYDLHEEYDRILHLDSDMLLTPDCPNLFDVVAYDEIGSIYEDVGSRKRQRVQCMHNAQNQFGNINWDSGYINTGVFVTSKCHRDIYEKINNTYFTAWGTDDIHIGYQINKLGFKIKELSYQYNHMTMFSEPWNGSPSRFDSHIIHYAGKGIFDSNVKDKLQQAKLDYERLYK
jgi:lipopolysaccharide biosynthesis glycosyltransferase